MTRSTEFDVIIIGGSYSGLASGMALGRALRKVLIVDDGKPCNRQTPYSHNFITQDGVPPSAIAQLARMQVDKYETVHFFNGIAVEAHKTIERFEVRVATGEVFSAKKLIFATGIKDHFPSVEGFDECWGISVLHCPYCHGYEVRSKQTGVIGNGDAGFDFVKLISNWTNDLTLFTNGKSVLTDEQVQRLNSRHIHIVEKEILKLRHTNGYVNNIIFKDGSVSSAEVLYAPVPFEQTCRIPQELGCELTEEGYIKVDQFQQTNVEGVFACGDNASRMRTVANAVGTGTTAGMAASKKLVLEEF
jgi:thioredoxin reductase